MVSIVHTWCDRCGEVIIRSMFPEDDEERIAMTSIEMTNWNVEGYEQLIAEICPQCDPIVKHEFELFLFKAGILK
jgi:uncharacterized cysteine cluster protein YcgN (CxxCxxCC family)